MKPSIHIHFSCCPCPILWFGSVRLYRAPPLYASQSCGSTPAQPHLLTSGCIHPHHVFLGLPCFVVLGIDTALLVDPQHALWTLHGFVADATKADSTGILTRFLEVTMANIRDYKLGLRHVDTEPFTFRASFHALSLEIHSSWVSAMSTRSST